MMKTDYIKRLQDGMKDIYEPSYIQACVDYAEHLLNKNLPVIFDRQHADKILQMVEIKFPCYNTFYIRGRSKEREITAPSRRLKLRQRWILDAILKHIPLNECCHGFVAGKSIVTNAKKHIGKKYRLTMDIQDFFPSIKEEQVVRAFKDIGYSKSAAARLAQICCFEGRLPQGAPSSPCLANLICRDMDHELLQISRDCGLTYTRYADDMTFSADADLCFLIPVIERTIEKYGFSVNSNKTRMYKENERKLITGLLVKEDSLRIPKKFKRKLKQEIYYCKKFGVSTHLENTASEKRVNFKEYLYGKAYYIKMVEPETGEYFLKQLDSIRW